MDEAKYDELLQKQMNKDYKKAGENLADDITKADEEIAMNLELSDRVYCTSKKDAFITLKDHKPSFACRLINPTKPELGKICSKSSLKSSLKSD